MFAGAKGTYLDLTIWPKDEPDQFGNTHTIHQRLSREDREKGMKEPIIGDIKMPDEPPPQQRSQQPQRPAQRPKPPTDPDLDSTPGDSGIPF